MIILQVCLTLSRKWYNKFKGVVKLEKIKHFKLSVIQHTMSKAVYDQNIFYTSDSDLMLKFELIEKEYSYDTGEILLYNGTDKSFVTRTLSKVDDGFVYQIDDDIIKHFGEWTGQLQLVNNGEVYTSKPFTFTIENDLSTVSPPPLVDFNSWLALKESANELIAEMQTVINENETAALAYQQAENVRSNNETNRKQAESTRQNNETIRQNQERVRESNEVVRKSNEFTREENETVREQAEQDRVTAESIRVENESVRIQAEQERNLDGAFSATGENLGTIGNNIRKTQTGEALLPESVKPHTTNFFNNEGNFFNINQIDVDTMLDANGALVFNETYCTSKLILLPTGVYSVNSVRRISKYTLAKTHVETIDVSPSAPQNFQISETCYVKISVNKLTVTNTSLVLGQNAPASYIEPKYVLGKDFYVGKKNISEPLDIELLNIAQPINYYNKETVIRDYMVGTQAGGLSQSDATIGVYAATDFIKVTPGLYFLTRNRNVVLYDDKKIFKSSYTSQQDQVNILEDGYIRITLYIDDVETTMVTKYSISDYVPYGQMVLDSNIKIRSNNILGSSSGSSDKVYVHFGDSITANGQLVEKIASRTGATHHNFAIGGTRLVDLSNPNSGQQKMNFLDLLRAKVSGDWSKIDEGVADIGSPVIANKIDEFKNFDMSEADVLSFMFGTNDIGGVTLTLGEVDSTNTLTTNGALNYALKTISETWPHLRVFVFAPIFRANMPYTNPIQNSDDYANNGTFLMVDMIDAIENKANEFKFPFKNLNIESGINRYNAHYYLMDGTHPNQQGDSLLAEIKANFYMSH